MGRPERKDGRVKPPDAAALGGRSPVWVEHPSLMDRSRDLPITRSLRLPYVASLVIAFGTASVSVAGLALGSDLYGTDPPLVLVSPGGDAANLLVVLPTLIGSMLLPRRESLIGLLLWPGALFYALYIYAWASRSTSCGRRGTVT